MPGVREDLEELASAAADDEAFRPAYLAMSHFESEMTDALRHEDTPELAAESAQRAGQYLKEIRAECRLVNVM